MAYTGKKSFAKIPRQVNLHKEKSDIYNSNHVLSVRPIGVNVLVETNIFRKIRERKDFARA